MDKLPKYEPPSQAWLMSCQSKVGAHYLFRDLSTGKPYVVRRSRRAVKDKDGNIEYFGLEESKFTLEQAPEHIQSHFNAAIASFNSLSLKGS